MTNSILKPCDYCIENLTFNPLLSNKKKSAQTILLPSYNGARSPMIQLPPIDLDMYGIPSKCDFYKEDWQRMFLKLPLNQKNSGKGPDRRFSYEARQQDKQREL